MTLLLIIQATAFAQWQTTKVQTINSFRQLNGDKKIGQAS